MSVRDKWEFEYTASDLADAAEKQRAHREGRMRWWEEQKTNVMEEVRSKGIEVSESLATQYHSNTAPFGPQVMVRTDLQTKLTEAHRKIQEHSDAARGYAGWVQVLRANPQARLKLHHDDWLYFFGQ